MIDQLLAGRTVVDLSRGVAAAYAARLLASLGADVVKIERPEGDPVRRLGPFPSDQPDPERSGLFLFLNAGKRGVRLDYTNSTGRILLLALAERADVVFEDGRLGWLGSLGLSYRDLSERNPGLVLCSVTPFGQTGPYRDFVANDLVSFALSGIAYTVGERDREPLSPREPQASLIAGTQAAVGALIALHCSEVTGEGQHVDVSIWECLSGILECATTLYEYHGYLREREGVGRPNNYADMMQVADGYVGVFTPSPPHWETMCLMIDQPEMILDPRFASGYLRAQNAKEISAVVEPWVAQRTKEEVLETAAKMKLPFAVVRDAKDLFESPQNRARGFFVTVDDPALGKVEMPSLPFRQAGGKVAPLGPAPRLGEHNEEILGDWLGLSAADLVSLRRAGVA